MIGFFIVVYVSKSKLFDISTVFLNLARITGELEVPKMIELSEAPSFEVISLLSSISSML